MAVSISRRSAFIFVSASRGSWSTAASARMRRGPRQGSQTAVLRKNPHSPLELVVMVSGTESLFGSGAAPGRQLVSNQEGGGCAVV